MSHFGPDNFNCKHKTLKKNKLSNSTYTCIQCNKDFVIIPAKNDPFYSPHHPRDPRNPDLPDLMPHYPGKHRFPKYM